jgi:hypothetical protein
MHFRDNRPAAAATRGKRKVDCEARALSQNPGNGVHGLLLPVICFRTSAAVTQLDRRRLSAKESRAATMPGDRFLYERAFEDCLDRLHSLTGSPGRIAVVGYPSIEDTANRVANAESVQHLQLETLEPECADAVIAVGVIDHAEDPAMAAFVLRHSLRPGGRLIGAIIGIGSLTRMRRAFLDAERAGGRAARRFHQLLDPSSLGAMLSGAGLRDVVIDVDGFDVRYSGLDHLVRDLRSMGCTNSLNGDMPPLPRAVYKDARNLFSGGAERVEERFEILHFSGFAK